mgnify:CR=1 FL=1
MKYTQSTLDKLEEIPKESGYVLRYERGSFQSGYCSLEERKVVVLNKFLPTEGRISTLKRGYGWDRTRIDGTKGTRIWTGHGVLTHNLIKISALAA